MSPTSPTFGLAPDVKAQLLDRLGRQMANRKPGHGADLAAAANRPALALRPVASATATPNHASTATATPTPTGPATTAATAAGALY